MKKRNCIICSKGYKAKKSNIAPLLARYRRRQNKTLAELQDNQCAICKTELQEHCLDDQEFMAKALKSASKGVIVWTKRYTYCQ